HKSASGSDGCILWVLLRLRSRWIGVVAAVPEEAVPHGVYDRRDDEEEEEADVDAEVARELEVVVEEDGEGLNHSFLLTGGMSLANQVRMDYREDEYEHELGDLLDQLPVTGVQCHRSAVFTELLCPLTLLWLR